MSDSPQGSPEIDPEEAGRREFAKTRRGFDQNEVRAHLLLMAAELKRLRAESADAVRRAARLEAQLDDRDSLDPATVTRILGEETARVLESAREAAEGIRLRAQTESDKLIEDSKGRAATVREDAELLRSNAAKESDELLAAARQQSQDLMDEARSVADETRRQAEESSEQMREEAAGVLESRTTEANEAAEAIRIAAATVKAEADTYAKDLRESTEAEIAELGRSSMAEAEERAETVVEAARERGRTMVAEAKEARERMLRDLAERRKVARRQLEAMRAGRERLLESFSAARTALDGATEDLVDSLPAAREAANDAAQGVDEDIDDAIAELEAEIGAGSDLSGDFESDLEAEIEASSGRRSSAVDGAITAADSGGSAESSDEAPESGSGLDDGEGVGVGSGAPVDLAEQESNESRSHLRLIANGPSSASDESDEDDGDDDDDDEDEDDIDIDDSVAPVDDLFARLRADTDDGPAGGEDATGDAEAVLETQHLRQGAVVIGLPGNGVSVADPSDDDESDDESEGAAKGSGGAVEDSPTQEGAASDQSVLDVRDELTDGLENDIMKRLKRLLSDQENKLLDRVRRDRKATTPSQLLPTVENASSDVSDAISGFLGEAVEAGATFLERSGVSPQTISAPSIVEEMVEVRDEVVLAPIRTRLIEIIENSEDDSRDRTELVTRLRSVYRDWRNEKLGQATGDMITLAFNKGILAASPTGSTMTWIVDYGGLACPDAEDNHLAGAVPVGDAYPTGDVCPTAHPGCRCLLVPTDS